MKKNFLFFLIPIVTTTISIKSENSFPSEVRLKNISGETVNCYWTLGAKLFGKTTDKMAKDHEGNLANGQEDMHGKRGTVIKVHAIDIKNVSSKVSLAKVNPDIFRVGGDAYFLFKKNIDGRYFVESVDQSTYKNSSPATAEAEWVKQKEAKAKTEQTKIQEKESTITLDTGKTSYTFYPSKAQNGAYYDAAKWQFENPEKGVLYFNAKATTDDGFLIQFRSSADMKFVSRTNKGWYYNLIINSQGARLESYFAKKKEDSADINWDRMVVVGTTSELKVTPNVSEGWRIIVDGSQITIKKVLNGENTQLNSLNIPEGYTFSIPEGFVIDKIKYFAFGGLNSTVEYSSIKAEKIIDDVNVRRLVFKENFKTPTPGSATIKFEFCGKSDIYVALSPEAKEAPENLYLLTLGAENNTKTKISNNRDEKAQKKLGEDVLDKISGGLKDGDGRGTTWNKVWITISGNNNIISYGKGDDPSKKENLIKTWTIAQPLEDLIEYIGFGGKGTAQFRNISITTGPKLSGKEALLGQVVVEIPLNLPTEFRGEASGPIAKNIAIGLDKKGNPIAFIIDDKDTIYYWDVTSFDDSPWVELPVKEKIKFKDIACTQNGTILALRDNGNLAKYNDAAAKWEDIKAPVLKNIKSIAISDTPISITKKRITDNTKVTQKATIFVIAGEGEERLMYFLGEKNTWIPLSKNSALSLSIGKDGFLVAVNNDEQIKKYNQTTGRWDELSDPNITKFLLVSAGNKDNIIAMATDYTLWKWNGKNFVALNASGPVDFGINAAGWIGTIISDGKFYCNAAKSLADIKKETRTQAQDKGKVKSVTVKKGQKTKVSGKAAKVSKKTTKVSKAKKASTKKSKVKKAKKKPAAKKTKIKKTAGKKTKAKKASTKKTKTRAKKIKKGAVTTE